MRTLLQRPWQAPEAIALLGHVEAPETPEYFV